MELWTIGNKTAVLLLVIGLSYFGNKPSTGWLVFYFLVYASLNLAIHIAKDFRVKQAGILAVMAYSAGCAVYVHPAFALLLPPSGFELVYCCPGKKPILLVAVMLPVFWLGFPYSFYYGFVAAYGYWNYRFVSRYMGKANGLEDKLERLRQEHEALAKRLNDNEMFKRTFEYAAKLEERNRLSQKIHDGIGHSMTGALIQMEAAKRLLAADPAKAEELLQNAIGISKAGIEEIRLTLKETKPPVEQLGWSRLKADIDSFGIQSGLVTSAVYEGNLDIITPLQWKIIRENVIEAMTNAAKYAQATAVHVEIRVLHRLIKAVVSDNGIGADKIVKGLGLTGMEERTAAVNGTVIADGSRGFSVTTLIPCTAHEKVI
jgi:signal transduction histidine kinase